jgi:asparagine synthase (glutamine-hydrolysing)
MCSISGVLTTKSIDRTLIARMNAAQRHRGPDDHGTWSLNFPGGEVALGNTRLAIIDTSSAGHQPMLDAQSRNCISYNGEAYNFKELSDLIRLNPRSKTDTEVVLGAYKSLGTACFDRLRGMFALAIWDNRKRELVLARDRFGIKPLYYYVSDELVIFASELRALLATGLIPRKLSRSGLDSYLTTGSVTVPLTIVEGVSQLPPGHSLRVKVIDSGTLVCTLAKFATDEHESPRAETRADAVAQLRVELEESIKAHLVSDVPLGVFLSGGMDSSALVALMSKVSAQRPKTFSVVFDEAELSEKQYSRSVAQRFNTDHCEIRLSEDRLLEMLPEAIAAFDQPSMDGVNTFVVSRAVKNAGVTVALSGLGGDELFAGYPSFRRALRFSSMRSSSKRVLRAAAGVGRVVLNGSVRRQKLFELTQTRGSPEEVYKISRQLFPVGFWGGIDGIESGLAVDADVDVVNAISRLELQGYMANTLLRDTDAMSMAHSLEVRVPLVDVKLVEYVLSLPGEWKFNGNVPKPLLADTVADLLPRDFLARRKMGFTLPFERWMQGRMRAGIEAVFHDDSLLRQVGLDPKTVRDVWRRFLHGPRAVGWSRPWALFVLAQWCQINRVTI